MTLGPVKDVAAASVFLACKVEESGRKLKDVASVCQSKASGNPPNPNAGENDPVRPYSALGNLLHVTLIL